MSRNEDKAILLSRPVPTITEQWNAIQTPFHIYNFLTYQDIAYLNQIARSNKLAGNPSKKKQLITQLMEARGFKKLDCGTNRIVFKFMEDQSFLIKVAFDKVALQDNIREYNNQEYLKPFCAKCFEVTPCGTVGLFERVYAVKSREEFASIAYTVFDIIVNCFLGKFVLADFGTKFYKNWGVREGAYPVILDYPYLYELDGGKLFCNKEDPFSETGYCGGEIDYDDGFNFLVCKKCGKRYLASELSKENRNKNILVTSKEETRMKIQITKRDGTVLNLGETNESKTYKKFEKKETPHEYQMRKSLKDLKVYITRRSEEPEQTVEETKPESKKVQVSSIYGEMVPNAGDEFKDLKVTITTKKGEKYIGEKAKNISPFSPAINYANLYGSGAEVVTNSSKEPVVESTATEVADEPIYNMDLSDTVPAGVYDAKYLERAPESKSDQMATLAANRIANTDRGNESGKSPKEAPEEYYPEDSTLNDLFMEETVSMDELNKDDKIIAAHCDSKSIRYKINNLEMTDENQNVQDEEERLKEFEKEKATLPSHETREITREMAQPYRDGVDEPKNLTPEEHVSKVYGEPDINLSERVYARSDGQVFYNGKPMPNFEKDRNLKVTDQSTFTPAHVLSPQEEEIDEDEKEKQYALDQF
mgnify:CR=1 FL=1